MPAGPASVAFFVSTVGTRLFRANVERTFIKLKHQLGLNPRSPRCRPRLHDLCHRFAVNTLIDWYRQGVDVQARLSVLSTYLGHYAGDRVKRAEHDRVRDPWCERSFQAPIGCLPDAVRPRVTAA